MRQKLRHLFIVHINCRLIALICLQRRNLLVTEDGTLWKQGHRWVWWRHEGS